MAVARDTEAPPELVARRQHECRLTPERALGVFGEAVGFLGDRSMLTLTPDCALPSLFQACHEEPYEAGGHGFAAWPRTKYSWGGQLAARADVLTLKVHQGKNLMLSAASARLADPICRAELSRMRSEDGSWRRLLDYLEEAGPSELGVVQEELGLRPKELKALRYPLERCGVLVARTVVLETEDGGHRHSSELARYDQASITPQADRLDIDPGAALGELLVAGVRAAVLAPERELPRWFSWRWYFGSGLADNLVRAGRLHRPATGWIAIAPD